MRRRAKGWTADAPLHRSSSTECGIRPIPLQCAGSSTRARNDPSGASSPSLATVPWRACRSNPCGSSRKRSREQALAGKVFAPVGHATHYHADYVLPYWADSLGQVDPDRASHLLPSEERPRREQRFWPALRRRRAVASTADFGRGCAGGRAEFRPSSAAERKSSAGVGGRVDCEQPTGATTRCRFSQGNPAGGRGPGAGRFFEGQTQAV